MKTKQVISLLSKKNIKIVDEGNIIYHDYRKVANVPLENHDAIILMDGVWKFCFVELERRNEPDIQVKKSFSSKSDALEHLFLNRLYWHWLFKYVVPNRDSVDKLWNIDVLREIMKDLSIPEKYLCTPEKLHEKSICVFKKDGKWFEAYIGTNKQMFESSEEGFDDEDWFFSIRINSIYCLYLLDKYTEELLKRKKIKVPFSDIQIANFLGYDI